VAELSTPAPAAPAPAPGPPAAGPAQERRRRIDGEWLRRYGVYVALALLVVVNVAITPNFLTVSNLRLQLVQVAPVVIVALGVAMVIGTGGIDLSVGAVIALSATLIPLYIGYGPVVAILVALAVGAASGALAGTVVARVGVQPIVATLALLVGLRGVANLAGDRIRPIRDPLLRGLGTGTLLGVPYVVVAAVVATAVVWFVLGRTTTGRQLVAVGGNLRAAALAGVPVERVLTSVYVASGLLAAVAGVLLAARLQAVNSATLGQLAELSAITAVVVGGTPLTGGQVRVLGTVAGALLLQLLSSTLIAQGQSDAVTQLVQAVIVVAAVYVQFGSRRTR
jgi:ribose/xylose/arabinose/galactoside ABC-type transport system permease subunit